jgi:outer membrane protein assembly factor BamB
VVLIGVPRRRRRLIAALLVAGILAATLVWWLIPAERFTYGVAPIGRDEAMLLTRRNESDRTQFWAQLVRTDGETAWTAEISPIETAEALGFSGIAANQDRVLLLGRREGTTVVMALDRETGDELWETVVPSATLERIGPMLLVDGPRVYAIHQEGDSRSETITALALDDGAILWRLGPRDGSVDRLHVELLAPARLVVTGRGPAGLELDGATGKVWRSLPFDRLLCTVPRGIVGREKARRVVLLQRPASDGQEATASTARLGADMRIVSRDGPCGERGGDLIIGAQSDDHNALSIVRIDADSGAVLWILPLGNRAFGAPVVTLDGRLPRFMPVSAFDRNEARGPIREEIVVVDLDRGAVRARYRTDENWQAFVTGDRAYAMSSFLRATVVALDPATGAVARVTRLDGVDRIYLRWQHLRFGHLWLSGRMGWARPSELDWAAMDLTTGRPVHLNGDVVATDLTTAGWQEVR